MHNKHLLIITNYGFPHPGSDYAGSIFLTPVLQALKKHFQIISIISPRPYIPKLFFSSQFAHKKGLNLSNYQDENIFVYYPRYLRVRSAYPLQAITKAVESCIQNNTISYDIMHAHCLSYSGSVACALQEKMGIPFVVTGHGQDVYQYPLLSQQNKQEIEQVVSAADVITTVSEKNKDILKNITDKPIQILYNGFHDQTFFFAEKKTARAQLNIPPLQIILVQVGRVEENKNQFLTVQACYEFKKQGMNVHCYFIGPHRDTEYLQKILQFAKEKNIEDQIHFLGSQNQSVIAQYLQAAQVSVIPSIQEGNPTVLFESLACGTPVVGSQIGGIKEIITPERGITFPVGNKEAFVLALRQVLQSNWENKAIAKNMKPYSGTAIANQWIKVYSQLLKK